MNRNQTDPDFCKVEDSWPFGDAPNCRPDSKDKYPKGRAIAAAYWISYFTLHWLLITDVIEFTTARGSCAVYFLLSAVIATFMIAAHEVVIAKEKE